MYIHNYTHYSLCIHCMYVICVYCLISVHTGYLYARVECLHVLCYWFLSSDILGVVTLSNMSSKILKGKVKPTDCVTKVLYNQFEMVCV